MLDFRLLGTCIGIIAGSITYFFYFNRVLAFLLGILFRLSFWNQGPSSVWLEIGAIHFSPVAGRILLKDVQYHSSNQTVRIVKMHILWRYWIRRPTTEEDLRRTRVGGEDHKHGTGSQSCRLHLSFEGFEWFMYNRTAAYDSIAAALDPDADHSGSRNRSEDTTEPRRTTTTSSGFESASTHPTSLLPIGIKAPRLLIRAYLWVVQQMPSLDPKDLLPIGLSATKGAIICGNASTPSLLVVEFRTAQGSFGIVRARSKLDFYKQILSFRFGGALVRYVENEELQGPMTATGQLVQEYILASKYATLQRSSYLSYRSFFKLWRRLKLYTLTPARRRAKPAAPRRSSKTPEDESPVGPESGTLEYAVERKILETPLLEVSYYADVVGRVPVDHRSGTAGLESFDIGNGDLPPEWGVDVVVRGGFLRYGPWADRQRAELQRAFFPNAYHDVEPTPYLKPGDQRLWTSLKVFIELRDETTLHIPFREASKNWQWDGMSDVPRPKKREPASIHIAAGDSSSISYIMPMVIGPKGYEPLLEVHLDSIVVTSSLNDIRLLTAETCRVRADLPSPLKWNGERQWTFAISLRQAVIYILRDHINMFTDLAKDWASGPPSDYFCFVPTIYALELDLHHYEVNLYANDQNIIDKPLDADENALVILAGPRLRHAARIPANVYRPDATTVPFFVEAPDLALAISVPRWNTHSSSLPNRAARIRLLRIDSSYRYYAEVHEEHIEQFNLNIQITDVAFKPLGWIIRYAMVLRDNYLGSFTNFSTLYEYLEKRKRGIAIGDPIASKYRKGNSNIFQCELLLSVTGMQLLLPAGLPGYETVDPAQEAAPGSGEVGVGACAIITLPELQLQLRLHDYYMEMALNIDTIAVCAEPECSLDDFMGSKYRASKENMIIDGIDITANRMFGPQPHTSTYICVWEISLGRVKGVLSALEGPILAAALNTFRLNFGDMANAPALEYAVPADPDVTFMKLLVGAVDVTWLAGYAAVEVSLSRGLTLDMNDLAGKYHRKVTSIRVPHISLKILVTSPSGRHNWLEAAHFTSDANLDIYSAPAGWQESARRQAEFIATQDVPTGRARLMKESLLGDVRGYHKNGLYLPQPRLSRTPDARAPGGRRMPRGQVEDKEYDRPRRRHGPSHVSDSDGEEGVSEADRDARLAQSRTLTRPSKAAHEPDRQSMSSGDESDNEDLTDGETSDSEWSDGDAPEAEGKSLLAQYHRITNRYSAEFLTIPSLWEGSPFTLTHDLAFKIPAKAALAGAPRQRQNPKRNTPVEQNAGATTFRVQCRKPIILRVTPLIVSAATRLEQDIAASCLSAELTLDAMTSQHLGDLLASQKPEGDTKIIDVHLLSVEAQLVQLVTYKKSSASLSDTKHAFVGPQRAISTITFRSSNGWHISGSVSGEEEAGPPRFSLGCDMSLSMDTVAARKRSLYDDAMADIMMSGIEAQISSEGVEIGLYSLAVDLGHSSSEQVVATGLVLARTTRELLDIYKRWNTRSSTLAQNLLYRVLKSSSDKFIVDPYSTIQPSYLVQSGRPKRLRTDAILVLLHYLRRSLGQMNSSERQAFLSPEPDVDANVPNDKLLPLLESHLASLALDADSSNISNISTLVKFFPILQSTVDSTPTPAISLNSGSLKIEYLSLAVWDPDRKAQSRLSITSLGIHARLRAPRLLNSNALASAILSQTSLRVRSPCNVKQISAVVAAGDINLVVLPHLMSFAQQVLRVRRRYGAASAPQYADATIQANRKRTTASEDAIHVVLTCAIRLFRVEAAAENLIFVFGLSGVQIASTVFAKPLAGQMDTYDQSMNHSVIFDQIYVRARSNVDTSKRSDSDILASLVLSGGKFNAVVHLDPSSNATLRITLILGGMQFDVPRSAIRLYRFIEEWRADFLPGVEATLYALLSEIESAKPPTDIRPNPKKKAVLHIHSHVGSLGVSLQVMHGTWLSWNAHQIIAYLKPSPTTNRNASESFGLQLASQVFSISHRPNPSRKVKPDNHVTLELPTWTVTGRYSKSTIYTIACVEFFHLIVKPSHWDTLLAVQQKFGQDFNDLVNLVGETRQRNLTPSAKQTSLSSTSLKYTGHLKMRGFSVGLEGITSTLFLECEDIGGGVNNNDGQAWELRLSDLALSLAPRAHDKTRVSGFNRKLRSAFVIIDLQASAGSDSTQSMGGQALRLTVTKIHAVMQPSSIGEIGDFIDHLQAEMLDRQERRATELAEFKEKTRNVMRTFEVKSKDVGSEAKSNWLSNYTVELMIFNIGVSFPLALEQGLQLPQIGRQDSSAVRAFLFSIKSLRFATQRGETGEAVMAGFSFQFVSRFRQSVAGDFAGDSHQTRNRLVYPQMTAQLRSETSTLSRKITVAASVSGFLLDIDSSIPDDVFALIDVYRQGQERVTRLADNIPRPVSASTPSLETPEPTAEKHYAALRTSSVVASLTFLSGSVRVYSGSASTLSRSRTLSLSAREPSDAQFLEYGADIFKLPMVSVWAEYRATPAAKKFNSTLEAEPSTLMFKSTIHSSQNTLRPTLLPFITEIVEHIEVRMRTATLTSPPMSPSSLLDSAPRVTTGRDRPETGAVSSLQISFSLKIDQSKLELTCQPDVNVIAGLHWDSGGFVINVSPGARNVTFTGTVGGLTIGLKHGFLSEECVRLDARNLAFSVQFAKRTLADGNSISSVSVVLDTQFSGGVRFSRLQDVLCFKAVWLDRIPIFNNQSKAAEAPPPNSAVETSDQEFTTALLLRIREIDLEVDLGQSISTVTLRLRDALIRTKLTEELHEVSLTVADVAILAKGNISGQLIVPNCLFQTIRRKEVRLPEGNSETKMLELAMTSGSLHAMVESDHQMLLQYRADPLEVNIFDDWSSVTGSEHDTGERPLRLSFTVSGKEVVAAATVGTIPKFLAYSNKFKANMDSQREGASRESKAFQMTRSPKPDNPLSDVANAMLRSARDRFKEAETELFYVIDQHLSLQLDSLRLVVFPRTMGDLEMAQFVGSDVQARLDRRADADTLLAKRTLHLSFSSMSISKYSQLNHPLPSEPGPFHGRNWLILLLQGATEANIVGLPSMHMEMSSEESIGAATKELQYNFNSRFVRREGMREFEDIYITLNMSLYSWLTILRKNLSREMNQVQASSSDWRGIPPVMMPRKRILEPLQLPDVKEEGASSPPRSSITPSASPLVPSPPGMAGQPRSTSSSSADPSIALSERGSDTAVETRASPLIPPLAPTGNATAFSSKTPDVLYRPGERHIERLNMRQLGEATPDVMHPFFMKKAGFNLEDSLPRYVHEYATISLEAIMQVLFSLYSKQLRRASPNNEDNNDQRRGDSS